MTVARSVADVLAEHVSFEVECIDRMYLNVYQPRLQHAAGVAWFLCGHRGNRFASSALMDPISKSFVASIHRFAAQHEIPWVDFVRGQRKDDVAHGYLAEFEAAGRTEGVLSSAGRRRRTWCSAPRSAATRSPARPTRGWCARPG